MSRRQVRRMIRWEAVLIAVFGAVLGAAGGSSSAWAMVHALRSQGITALTIPVGQLIVYIVLAGIFGVIAALWPGVAGRPPGRAGGHRHRVGLRPRASR
jgi:putative ABC transport system permease protein